MISTSLLWRNSPSEDEHKDEKFNFVKFMCLEGLHAVYSDRKKYLMDQTAVKPGLFRSKSADYDNGKATRVPKPDRSGHRSQDDSADWGFFGSNSKKRHTGSGPLGIW